MRRCPSGWSTTLVKRLRLDRQLAGHDGAVVSSALPSLQLWLTVCLRPGVSAPQAASTRSTSRQMDSCWCLGAMTCRSSFGMLVMCVAFKAPHLRYAHNACLPPPLCRDWQLGTRALEFHSGEGGSNRRADRLTGWRAMCRRTLSRTGPWRCRPPQQRVPSPGHAPVNQRHRGDLRSRRHGEGGRHPPGMWRCSGGDQAAGLPSWASSQAVAGTGQPSLLPVLW